MIVANRRCRPLFMHSLRFKILATAAALVLVSQAGTVSTVLYTANKDVSTRAAAAMQSGASVLGNATRSRANQLGGTVQALASDYGFKQAISTRENETIASALQNHARRADADIAFVLDAQRHLIAATDQSRDIFEPGEMELTAERFAASGRRVHVTHDAAYEIFTVPVKAPVPIAWLSLGFRVDHAFASYLHDLSGLDVTVLHEKAGQEQVIATSGTTATDRALLEAGRATAGTASTITLDIDGEPHLATRTELLATQSDVGILVTKSLAEAMAPYELLKTASLALGTLPLLAALLGAWLLSRALTQPVNRLMEAAQRIRSGDYSSPVDIRSGDELSEFGVAFNAMQSEIASRERSIVHQARHDSVTGLHNADYARDLLEPLVDKAWNSNLSVGALVIRLGALDELSASLGQDTAHEYLREAARRLKSLAGEDYILARLENDSFLLALIEDDATPIRDVANNLASQLSGPILLPSMQVRVSPTIGIAVFPKHANNVENLLLRAIVAVNEACADGRPMRFYREGDHEKRMRNLTLLQDLPRAASDNELQLFCQPKISLPDESVCGAEALVRWQHPEYGWLMPNEFVPLAEKAGHTGVLTRWVIRAAARQLSEWRAAGLRFELAVNLSSNDLTDPEMPWYIMDTIKEFSLDPKQLVLEVTEEAMVADFNKANSALRHLGDLGLLISIDDFGTGFSSLAQLKKLPAQELKIDRCFVTNLPDDAADAAIVSATVELAGKLGLRTVAEGVENGNALRWLQSVGVDRAQGFYWSEPLPCGQFAEWVAHFTGGSTRFVKPLKLV